MGKLDEGFLAALLENPTVRELSASAQAVVFDAILKLKPESLATLGKAFGQAMSLWDEEKVNALGCTFNALTLVHQGAEFDEVVGALALAHTGAMPDEKLAPMLGAAFLSALMQRNPTYEQVRMLAMNLDGIAVRAPGELAYPGIMEAFCELAKEPAGRVALGKIEQALVPHILDFNNMCILPVEKRQACYMAGGACRAALYFHDNQLPERGSNEYNAHALGMTTGVRSAYFGLCLYSHDVRHSAVKGFARDSEKFLVYAMRFGYMHPADSPDYAKGIRAVAKRHRNDPGDAGKNASAHYASAAELLYTYDPDNWFEKEHERLMSQAEALWSSGQLNTRYEGHARGSFARALTSSLDILTYPPQ
jgi:hypothetical protein